MNNVFTLRHQLDLGGGGSLLLPETKAYRDRVLGDNTGAGLVIDVKYINDFYKMLRVNTLTANLVNGVHRYGGVRLRTVGADNFINKWYDLASVPNDYAQTTDSLQPLLQSTGIKFDGVSAHPDMMESSFSHNSDNPFTVIWKVYTTAFPEGRILGYIKNAKDRATEPLVIGLHISTSADYRYLQCGSSDKANWGNQKRTEDIISAMSNAYSYASYDKTNLSFKGSVGTITSGGSFASETSQSTTRIGNTISSRQWNQSVVAWMVFNKVLTISEIQAIGAVI